MLPAGSSSQSMDGSVSRFLNPVGEIHRERENDRRTVPFIGEYIQRGQVASEALARFIEEHELTIDQPIVHESCGSFATDILNVASEKNADLVVVAPGSKNIFEAAILGRVSLAVLRQTECDVLILPVG